MPRFDELGVLRMSEYGKQQKRNTYDKCPSIKFEKDTDK